MNFKYGDTVVNFSNEAPNHPVKGFLLKIDDWGEINDPHPTYTICDLKNKNHIIVTGADFPETRIHTTRLVLVEKIKHKISKIY